MSQPTSESLPTRDRVKLFYSLQEEGRLEVGPTAWGRLVWALERWGIAWPVMMVGISVFFLPDYFGKYAAQEGVQGIFWVSLLAVAGFVSMLLGILRFLRHERWIFDGEARALVYQTRTLYGTLQEESVPLREIQKIEIELAGGLRSSRIVVAFAGGHREVVCKTRWRVGEVREIADALREFLKKNRYEVTWVTA